MPELCIIPAAALQDDDLTGTDIRVLCAIGKHTDRNGVGCWAKAATLADEARVSRNQFFISTRRLIESGYVERDSGQEDGNPSKYAIVFPSLSRRGVSKSGTPGESPKTGRGSLEKQDATTISASISVASPLGKRFTESQLEAINLFLSRVPEHGRIAWTMEMAAMLDGMPGHVLATPEIVAKAALDATANGKSSEPNMRQFRRYVAGAVESAGVDNLSASDERAREVWRAIRERGILQAQTVEIAQSEFQDAIIAGDLDMSSGLEALKLFLTLDRKLLRATTSEEVAVRHIAEKIAKRSRG